MSGFAIISLAASWICFFLGNFVYYKDPKNKLNKFFMLLCLSSAYWAIVEFGYRQADNMEVARSWMRMGFLWPLSISFLLHFVLIFTKKIIY